MSLNIRIPVLAGTISKPTLRAVPSNVVATGNQVAFFCGAPVVAKEYRPYKEGSQDYLTPTTILKTENKAIFSISSFQWYNSGQYWCGYTSSHGPSEHSDTLELVVTGHFLYYHSNISLSATPSPVVTSGGNVTLQWTLKNHNLQAEPRFEIASGKAVTILCEGTKNTQLYFLYKEGSPAPLDSQTPQGPSKKAIFSIASMERRHAGKYRCYSYGSLGWSKHSDPLDLVVTGIYSSKLTLSALPSPVVTPAWNGALQCGSQQAYDRFILMKDDQIFSSAVSLKNTHRGLSGAHFRVGPVTPNQRWRFTCYAYYLNNSQVWSVSSVYSRKVTLSTLASHLVTSGQNATLQCVSQQAYNGFILLKEDQMFSSAVSSPNINHGLSGAHFKVGPVTPNQRWRFTCYGYYLNNHQVWSVSSNDIQLLVSGVHDDKPTLSALPSPVVTSGGNVTLQCISSKGYDGFTLTGADLKFSRSQKSQFTNKTKFQALFSEISVTYSKNGPFRCYGYYTNTSYVWSEASNPLEIHVSGEEVSAYTQLFGI
ncbi:leukocyte immunoglobulin-like receptor subfamily A member 6 [Cricetulus griseus]|uniref:leukocyte immunoglobulin-like receptor subfamily A member 6 n=1 Tax=Cricetulus griseus TaxID=10029 RepID=UPI0007DAA74C|nr:leukocyte immunoglobulin-like receptor subfamily A member 6 [Cricetulus griseus]